MLGRQAVVTIHALSAYQLAWSAIVTEAHTFVPPALSRSNLPDVGEKHLRAERRPSPAAKSISKQRDCYERSRLPCRSAKYMFLRCWIQPPRQSHTKLENANEGERPHVAGRVRHQSYRLWPCVLRLVTLEANLAPSTGGSAVGGILCEFHFELVLSAERPCACVVQEAQPAALAAVADAAAVAGVAPAVRPSALAAMNLRANFVHV